MLLVEICEWLFWRQHFKGLKSKSANESARETSALAPANQNVRFVSCCVGDCFLCHKSKIEHGDKFSVI